MVLSESRSTSVMPFVINHATVYSSPREKDMYKFLSAELRVPGSAESYFREDLSISFRVLEGCGNWDLTAVEIGCFDMNKLLLSSVTDYTLVEDSLLLYLINLH